MWTVESLYEHINTLLVEQDRRYTERFTSAEAALLAALASADKATEKAEANAEKWRENANEWRGAMTDRERTLMSRVEAEAHIKAISERVAKLEGYSNENYGGRSASAQTANYLIQLAPTIIAIIAVIIAVVK